MGEEGHFVDVLLSQLLYRVRGKNTFNRALILRMIQ